MTLRNEMFVPNLNCQALPSALFEGRKEGKNVMNK